MILNCFTTHHISGTIPWVDNEIVATIDNIFINELCYVGEIKKIIYGAELPEDLAANMNEVLANAKNI